MENEETVSCLHKCLLVIADEIKRICDENGLQYFLIAGTLLGAVRHHGFIPWDDDMDVALLREDYNKFISACKSSLSPEFTLLHYDTFSSYGLPYAKIVLNGTCFREDQNPKDLPSGIFVDVFPFDKMPQGKLQSFYHKNTIQLCKGALLTKCGYDISCFSGKAACTVYKLFSVLPRKLLISCGLFFQTRFNKSKKSEYYLNVGTTYVYGREKTPISCLDRKLDEIPFEDRVFPVPFEPEKTLTLLYGDFMQLPPEEKRVFRHLNDDISFGKYNK